MSGLSIEDCRHNHFDVFIELAMDSLRFASIISSALATQLFEEKVLQLIVENFVIEQMNLTKSLIVGIKKIHLALSSVLKVVHTTLDVVIKLSRAYLERIKHHLSSVSEETRHDPMNREHHDGYEHVIGITVSIVQNLNDLGIISASGGGNLVTLLNLSWKGIVSLLQLGKGVLSNKINVGDIIATLLSLALESLQATTSTWTHELKENLTLVEAKRSILPVKFFLINAVRIYSEYPCQVMEVCRMAGKCALTISCLGLSFSKDNIKAASEVLAEILEPTCLLLLCSMLNSVDVKYDVKLQLLDTLFVEDGRSFSATFGKNNDNLVPEVISISQKIDIEGISDTGTLMLGRLMLFLSILKSSGHLKEDIVIVLSRKLEFVLNCLVNEDVYACTLGLHAPLSSSCGKTHAVVWQPVTPHLLHGLQTFMIVASSLEPAWNVVEYFLLENLLHPHVLCVEIVLHLWCFLVRNSKQDTIQNILDTLCSMLKMINVSEPTLAPFSDLRKMARSIAIIASSAPKTSIDHLYTPFIADERSETTFILHVAMLMEGFPLDLLSENVRSRSFQQIRESFFKFLRNKPLDFTGSNSSSILGLPVHALSCFLQHCQISTEVFDNKTTFHFLSFVISVIRGCKTAVDGLKERYRSLFAALFEIISVLKGLYTSEEMRKFIVELQTLLLSDAGSFGIISCQCKASFSSFMAGLCHLEVEESDTNSVCCALWALYHALLRERHWAFIHLALVAFGYFTARTSCSELWRFVPNDAALSFDINTGKESCEERFMTEFKSFLEKETPFDVMGSSKAQLDFLRMDGILLKEKALKISNFTVKIAESNAVKVDENKHSKSKKRKMPEGVGEGLAMLQNGLKSLNDAFSHNDASDFKEEFSSHLSCLEDVVSHLFRLTDIEK